MPDGYDKDRDEFDPNKRGRIFENGTYTYFRDRENGYVQQSRIFTTAKGRVQFDKIREVRGLIFTIEDKSGRMDGKKDETQLKAVRALLDRGVIEQHVLRSVQGEYRSNEIQKLIEGLVRDFPDKFTHQEISRETAREIWSIGLQREAGQQLEFPGVREKARQQNTQQREQQSKAAELAKKARERAAKFRNMLRFREGATRARPEAPQRAEHVRRAQEQAERTRQAGRTPETERARVEREAAERVAQEFPVPSHFQERDAADAGGKAAREVEAASVERAAAEARAAAEEEREAAFKAREAAEKGRAEELARLQARGIPPEVVQLLGIGQAQPPSAAVKQPPGTSPRVQRGYWHSQERSRGIERGR
ncbi:hypothetical protein [Nocardia abscessus]|uniref:hypothetical protein n=1 Tax=Nocardia abscessus TaxID=120957 RepID=UPI0005B79A44|nr:hypothetical protein [Nocardia abscessus]MCC3329151.1 hypothetical protein [Nocardia abscessus]